MAKCSVCGKQQVVGGSIVRKGLAKKVGGIGTHVVKNNKRVFKANIQNVRVRTNGGVKKMQVCTACIRSGKVEKA